MTNYPLHKIILFEYDTPIDINNFLSSEAGLWSWVITNTFAGVTDDYSVNGYYWYQQSIKHNIKSLKVDNIAYSKVISIADCRETNKSFYYDTVTTKIYIHFDNFEPPLNKDIFYGSAIGYSKIPNNINNSYFNGFYYEPRLISVPGITKSVDALFFGLLKYSTGTVTLTNKDGEFDDWRSRNLFGQPARILVLDVGTDYKDFDVVFEGFISDDSRNFDEFTLEIEDPRKALTQPVASNTLTIADYPYIKDNNVNAVKPVAYGTIKNAKAICLNEDDATAADRIFLIADTEWNLIDSLDAIYVDGVLTSITGSADLTAGTFTMTKSSVFNAFDKVTIDFTATDFDNGVEIIKDLMANYDFKPFNSSFWDATEVNAASLASRSTSLYISDGSLKLSDAIEKIAVDIDGRFFVKNSGLYTIRIYDEDRTPNTKELLNDEWLDYPTIENNASEYLSSAIIKYNHDLDKNKYQIYENTNYRQEAFDRYKKLKVGEFETNLTTLSDAKDKSETIMNISKEVQDVITRTSTWNNFGIEPTDFVIGSPTKRYSSTDESRGIYEVLSIKSDPDDFKLSIKLRYVKDYNIEEASFCYSTIDDTDYEYILDTDDISILGLIECDPILLVDENGNNIVDENDNKIYGVI